MANSVDMSFELTQTQLYAQPLQSVDADGGNDSEDINNEGKSLVNDPEQPITVLTPELIAGINKQIAFYFSDTNLPTDKKFLKQIRKDPEGFVPIKLFANFRKVRAITKEVELITEALKSSNEIVLSPDLTRARRRLPVPDYDVTSIQVRTVVVENLPESPTIESVTDMFTAYGAVKLVRICSKENKGKLPLWLTSSCRNLTEQHAYVEFESEESAIMAAASLNEADEWMNGLTVARIRPTGSTQTSRRSSTNTWDGRSTRSTDVSAASSRRNTRDQGLPGRWSLNPASLHGELLKQGSIVGPPSRGGGAAAYWSERRCPSIGDKMDGIAEGTTPRGSTAAVGETSTLSTRRTVDSAPSTSTGKYLPPGARRATDDGPVAASRPPPYVAPNHSSRGPASMGGSAASRRRCTGGEESDLARLRIPEDGGPPSTPPNSVGPEGLRPRRISDSSVMTGSAKRLSQRPHHHSQYINQEGAAAAAAAAAAMTALTRCSPMDLHSHSPSNLTSPHGTSGMKPSVFCQRPSKADPHPLSSTPSPSSAPLLANYGATPKSSLLGDYTPPGYMPPSATRPGIPSLTVRRNSFAALQAAAASPSSSTPPSSKDTTPDQMGLQKVLSTPTAPFDEENGLASPSSGPSGTSRHGSLPKMQPVPEGGAHLFTTRYSGESGGYPDWAEPDLVTQDSVASAVAAVEAALSTSFSRVVPGSDLSQAHPQPSLAHPTTTTWAHTAQLSSLGADPLTTTTSGQPDPPLLPSVLPSYSTTQDPLPGLLARGPVGMLQMSEFMVSPAADTEQMIDDVESFMQAMLSPGGAEDLDPTQMVSPVADTEQVIDDVESFMQAMLSPGVAEGPPPAGQMQGTRGLPRMSENNATQGTDNIFSEEQEMRMFRAALEDASSITNMQEAKAEARAARQQAAATILFSTASEAKAEARAARKQAAANILLDGLHVYPSQRPALPPASAIASRDKKPPLPQSSAHRVSIQDSDVGNDGPAVSRRLSTEEVLRLAAENSARAPSEGGLDSCDGTLEDDGDDDVSAGGAAGEGGKRRRRRRRTRGRRSTQDSSVGADSSAAGAPPSSSQADGSQAGTATTTSGGGGGDVPPAQGSGGGGDIPPTRGCGGRGSDGDIPSIQGRGGGEVPPRARGYERSPLARPQPPSAIGNEPRVGELVSSLGALDLQGAQAGAWTMTPPPAVRPDASCSEAPSPASELWSMEKSKRPSKKDYASWAAAMPESRAECVAKFGTAGNAKEDGGSYEIAGGALTSSPQAGVPSGLGTPPPARSSGGAMDRSTGVIIARGPDGTSGFGGRRRSCVM
eukprot:gene11920-15022_t